MVNASAGGGLPPLDRTSCSSCTRSFNQYSPVKNDDAKGVATLLRGLFYVGYGCWRIYSVEKSFSSDYLGLQFYTWLCSALFYGQENWREIQVKMRIQINLSEHILVYV